jgi:threonine dehydrogenase-like Zn-dependent dehydrogenase
MQLDQIRPMIGITKELNLQFALGYQPLEFGAALTAIAEQRVDLAPMITGIVNLDGVPQAFQDLANPEAHAKLLVRP